MHDINIIFINQHFHPHAAIWIELSFPVLAVFLDHHSWQHLEFPNFADGYIVPSLLFDFLN